MMDEIELENKPFFAKEQKWLVVFLVIYCVTICICRVIKFRTRFLSGIDWMTISRDFETGRLSLNSARNLGRTFFTTLSLENIPYYLMPFIGLYWLVRSKQTEASLFYIRIMSFIGTINHSCSILILLYLTSNVMIHAYEPRWWITVFVLNFSKHVPIPAVLAGLSYILYRKSSNLCRLKRDKNSIKHFPVILGVSILVILLHILPFFDFNAIW